MPLEEDADNYPVVPCPALPSVPCSQWGRVPPVREAHFHSGAALAQKNAFSQHGTRKNLQHLAGFHAFYFKLQSFRTGIFSQSPTRHLAEPACQPGQAGFAQGAMGTWGMVFVGSGDAPGLAELGLTLSESCKWCRSQGSTPHCQTLESVPFSVITKWISHLAMRSVLLCVSLSEV